MGHTGSTVEFRDADQAPRLSPFAVMLEGLAARIDDISVSSVKIAREQATQLRNIEEARVFAVGAAAGIPGNSRHSSEDLALRSLTAQVAGSMRISELAARRLVWTAQCLATDLPLTMSYLADGAITLRHAQILVDQVGLLEPESITMLEQNVLPRGSE